MVCITDAYYSHQLFTRRAQMDKSGKFTPPKPFTPPKSDIQPPVDGQKVQVAQHFSFQPFNQFNELIQNVSDWIFQELENESTSSDDRISPWQKINPNWSSTEPSVTPFNHGLICTIDLGLRVLFKVDQAVRKNPVNQAI
ncbi:mediator complex subunit [Umbelopsis sp. WA50703]